MLIVAKSESPMEVAATVPPVFGSTAASTGTMNGTNKLLGQMKPHDISTELKRV